MNEIVNEIMREAAKALVSEALSNPVVVNAIKAEASKSATPAVPDMGGLGAVMGMMALMGMGK